MYKCRHCGKEFEKSQYLCGHVTKEHFVGIHSSTLRKQKRIEEYNKNPKLCLECNKTLPYRTKSKFCSKHCSSKYNSQNKNNDCVAKRHAQKIVEWLETKQVPGYTGGNSGYSVKNKYIRNYILEQQDYKCAICGIFQAWCNRFLKFILDHIDGCSTNNTRENLRLICPNCDSQTSTYKNRNKGKGRRSLGFSANAGL